MKRYKAPLLFTLLLLPVAIVGSVLVAFYSLETYTPETVALMLSSAGGIAGLVAISAVQGAVYAAIAGFFGYILANKVGLMRPLGFTKTPLVRTLIITGVCGALFSLDKFVFGALIPEVAAFYAPGISAVNFFSALLYGGVVEEILMRLFLMSLLSLLIWKLCARKYPKDAIPAWVFIAANVFSALLFAAGHLPATINMFGRLDALILFRCFLLNGALGLVFGRLYRKYGIQYAIVCHMGCHFVSKIIWIAAGLF